MVTLFIIPNLTASAYDSPRGYPYSFRTTNGTGYHSVVESTAPFVVTTNGTIYSWQLDIGSTPVSYNKYNIRDGYYEYSQSVFGENVTNQAVGGGVYSILTYDNSQGQLNAGYDIDFYNISPLDMRSQRANYDIAGFGFNITTDGIEELDIISRTDYTNW